MSEKFRREPAGQLIAGGRQTTVAVVVDDSRGTWLRLTLMRMGSLGLLLLLLLLRAHTERWWHLLHVLVANGTLLLLLVALLQQLLHLVHLVLVLIVGLLLL